MAVQDNKRLSENLGKYKSNLSSGEGKSGVFKWKKTKN